MNYEEPRSLSDYSANQDFLVSLLARYGELVGSGFTQDQECGIDGIGKV